MGFSSSTNRFRRLRRFAIWRRRECAHVESLLSLLADGRATAEDRKRIETHLEGCAGCRAATKVMTVLRSEFRQRPIAMIPSALPSRLLAAVEREREREANRRLVWTPATITWGGIGTLAAAACIAMLFGVFTHAPRPVVQTPGVPAVHIATNLPPPVVLIPSAPLNVPRGRSQNHTTVEIGIPTYVRPIERHRIVVVHRQTDLNTFVASLPKEPSHAIHETEQRAPADLPQNQMVARNRVDVAPPVTTPEAVASAPEAPQQPVQVATAIVADNDMAAPPLRGLLRQLAISSEENAARAATVSLGMIAQHPVYSETVSMVSAPAH